MRTARSPGHLEEVRYGLECLPKYTVGGDLPDEDGEQAGLQRTNVVEVMSSRTDIRPVSSREVRPDRDRMDRLEGFLSSW